MTELPEDQQPFAWIHALLDRHNYSGAFPGVEAIFSDLTKAEGHKDLQVAILAAHLHQFVITFHEGIILWNLTHEDSPTTHSRMLKMLKELQDDLLLELAARRNPFSEN